MLRAALAQTAAALAPSPWVERQDARQNAFDRFLLRAAGRLRAAASPWRVRRLRRFAAAVLRLDAGLQALDEAGLRTRIAAARERALGDGLTDAVITEIFALVREVSARALGKRHFPVQLMGGRCILDGQLAEMQTGEGKTLTALLPAICMALAGVPVHVVTVNEYLAARDATEMGPVYAFFGLSVGQVLPQQQPAQRREAYRCDVAYCVNKDLTFDYLRDRIEALRGTLGARAGIQALVNGRPGASSITRGLWFAIVDEADSVFIDEARTPLIISCSQPGDQPTDAYDGALAVAAELERDVDYLVRERDRQALLTEAGRARVLAIEDGRLPQVRIERARMVEQALGALHCYLRDRHYIVADGKVQIVDEYTGRVMPDRSWEAGQHQMVERKEALALTDRRHTSARITYQRVFRRYLRVGGMSGTVVEAAAELKAVLGVDVLRIPTHRPVRRVDAGVTMYLRSELRDAAVVDAALREARRGRAVLVGTRSVAASERLAALLAPVHADLAVLNAKQDAEEAAIVARAGQPGRITVATNMAGRGTDIHLADPVRAAGGLHVVLTEFHDAKRIDRQLFGRAGRQGDPGSHECIVALDDELFRAHAPELQSWIVRRAAARGPVVPRWQARMLRRWAQWHAEAHHAGIRAQTLARERDTDRLLAFAGRPE